MKRLLFVLSALFVFMPFETFAQGAWEIKSFHADIHVAENGSMRVKETIDVNFFTSKHGIYRDIPVKYRNQLNQHISLGLDVVEVSDDEGHAHMYEVIRDGAYRRIKIGDPNAYVEGPVTYVIEYNVERGLRYFDDHDELYWNITGTQWEVPIQRATASVYLPFESIDGLETICYTGPLGSTEQNCETVVESGVVRFSADDFLTAAISWPKGLVDEPSAMKKAGWFLGDNFGFLLPVFALAAGYVVWAGRGRDPRGRGIVRQYDAPDKLSPAEMGYLVYQSFRNDFIAAEIISLAEQGFLTIAETEKKGWFSQADYEISLMKHSSEAEGHRRVLLEALEREADGGKLKISDLPQDFYKEVEKVKAAVWNAVEARQYFAGKPGTVVGVWVAAAIGIGVVLFVLAALFAFRFDLLVGAILSSAVLIVFAVLMSKRTEAGVAAYQHALGFKQYIAAAETERVKWQEKENLFFDVLPYAMVFGIADKWAKAFEGKLQQPPQWYSGTSVHAFSPVHFSNSLSGFSTATVSHSSPPSSSSSGFSGGSSGGGGGGGGGGSW